VYWYDLAVPGASLTFNQGDLITFSGMSGVTSAAAIEEVSNAFAANVSFTATTAVFKAGLNDTYPNDQGAPYSYFEIDPPASQAGTINWSIQTATGTFSGTVQGPVALGTSAPEPAAATFVGFGMITLLATLRRSIGHREQRAAACWKAL
jgi:hypothetical protein